MIQFVTLVTVERDKTRTTQGRAGRWTILECPVSRRGIPMNGQRGFRLGLRIGSNPNSVNRLDKVSRGNATCTEE